MELLWKYVEGKCSPAEKIAIEKLLVDDPSFKKELEMARQIHAALKDMEADAPSMRFAKNVADALPDICSRELTEPLIKPMYKKIFWGGIFAAFTLLVLLSKNNQPSENILPLHYLDNVTDMANNMMGQVPGAVMLYFVLTLLSVGLLLMIDKVMMKKAHGFMLV